MDEDYTFVNDVVFLFPDNTVESLPYVTGDTIPGNHDLVTFEGTRYRVERSHFSYRRIDGVMRQVSVEVKLETFPQF